MFRRVLTRVFARRTRRFVTPSNHRGYLRLAKALIRLLRSADVQSQSVQADPSHRTNFIVGFAMRRLMRELFVQTLTLSTLGTIFSRRHFEIFFSFFQENIIRTSCKLSPLHETTNPVFLVMKRKKRKRIQSVVCWIGPEDAFPPMRKVYTMHLFYSLNKLRFWFCISHILKPQNQEHFTWKRKFWKLLYKPINIILLMYYTVRE